MRTHVLQQQREDDPTPISAFRRPRPIAYFVSATVYVTVVILLTRQVQETAQLWLACMTALLLALPPLLTLLYTSTIKTIHRSSIFTTQGLLKRLFASRLLKTVGFAGWALLHGALSVFWLSALTGWEVAILYAAIPLLFLIHLKVENTTKREITEYASRAYALVISRRLLTLILALGLLIHPLFVHAPEGARLLRPALNAIAATPFDLDKSYLVQLSSRLFLHLHAVNAYVVESSSEVRLLYIALAGAANLALAFHFTLLLSAFAIPVAEYRRVFGAISDAPVPPSVSVARSAFASAIVVLSLFILVSLLYQLELLARNQVALTQIVSTAEQKLVTYAEEIDGVLYAQGTLEDVAEARIQALFQQSESVEGIRTEAKRAFSAMRLNVDDYLDWYYSLPAEYLRIAGAFTGNIEETIRRDLEAALMKGQPFHGLNSAVLSGVAGKAEILQNFAQRRDAILSENRLHNPAGDTLVVHSATLDELLAPPEDAVLVNLNQRLTASGVGAIAGIVAAKIVGKVAAKGSIKLAAKALAKVGATKLAGAGGGAATGAVIGSIFPGIGTLIGGVVGAAVGLALGISIDALLLQLESYYSRDDFRNQIIGAIDAQEREFLALLEG